MTFKTYRNLDGALNYTLDNSNDATTIQYEPENWVYTTTTSVIDFSKLYKHFNCPYCGAPNQIDVCEYCGCAYEGE